MNQNLQTILISAGTAITGVILATALGIGPKTTTSVVKIPAKTVTLTPKANSILTSNGTTVEESISEIKEKVANIERAVGDVLRDGSKAVREGVIDDVERKAKEEARAVKEAAKEAERKAKEEARAVKKAAKENPLSRLLDIGT